MNIFILDLDPIKCAQYHIDKHVVKMITETAQLLSTCYHQHGESGPYKKTHVNHPCSIWVCESSSNYEWLYNLGISLYEEYKFRYDNKEHKAGEIINKYLTEPPSTMIDKTMTPFALVMPEEYITNDPVQSYRDYYMSEKKHLAKWKKRGKPKWWRE